MLPVGGAEFVDRREIFLMCLDLPREFGLETPEGSAILSGGSCACDGSPPLSGPLRICNCAVL